LRPIMDAMATVPRPASTSDAPSGLPSAAAEQEPQLFRFGLRQFFLFVTGVAMLLGTMALVRGAWSGALAFFAALIAAHVLATLVGTRLRDSSADLQRWAGQRFGESEPPTKQVRLTPAELAALADTPLAKHENAPLRTVLAVATGLSAGGFLGAAGVPLIAGPEATGAGIALGAASCAVMGAWLALLVAHFGSVARRAWRDANRAVAAPKGNGKQMAGADDSDAAKS
jgi:hypothetical protein